MREKRCRICGLERLEEGDCGTHYEGKEWCKCGKNRRGLKNDKNRNKTFY